MMRKVEEIKNCTWISHDGYEEQSRYPKRVKQKLRLSEKILGEYSNNQSLIHLIRKLILETIQIHNVDL